MIRALIAALAVTACSTAAQSHPAVPHVTETATATVPGCILLDGKADRHCTPGVTNPAVTQDTIPSTICVRGWTATIRPPASYTDQLKVVQMARYNEHGTPSSFEEDHLIPLELGGSPADPSNLWPQPWNGPVGAHAKDREENALHREVCAHTITLAEAQATILRDWSR